MTQYYRIAGLTVKMDSFGRTASQAVPYLTEPQESTDLTVIPNTEFIRQHFPDCSDDMVEYMATGSNFYRQLLHFDGMMLHSSAVVVDNRAYLFTADSGTGKSTHTKLWLELFGEKAYLLNDDKPALRLEDGVWYAYGTPWSGKHDISVNTRVPLGGIACLERNKTNSIVPYSGVEAVHDILAQVNRPRPAEYRIMLLELMDKLMSKVPVWKLKCNMTPEAAIVSYEAMSGMKWKENE